MENYKLNGLNEITEKEKASNYLNELLRELKEQMRSNENNKYQILIGIDPDNKNDTNKVNITRKIIDKSNDRSKKRPKRKGETSNLIEIEEANKKAEEIINKMQSIITKRSINTYNILIEIEPDLKNHKKEIIIREIERKQKESLRKRYTNVLIKQT